MTRHFVSTGATDDEILARVEQLLSAQPPSPPEAGRTRRAFSVVATGSQGARHGTLEIAVDEAFDSAYSRPGQYVTLGIGDGEPRFYVIASRVRRQHWEFLIDRRGQLGPELTALSVGDEVVVSRPEGQGFKTSPPPQRALLFCTGSGLATMRPLIESWLGGGDRPEQIALYYGERKRTDFAYTDLLEGWRDREGVSVFLVAETDQPGQRYVQQAFAADHPPLAQAVAYLSGASVMIRTVSQVLMARGIAPGNLRTNI